MTSLVPLAGKRRSGPWRSYLCTSAWKGRTVPGPPNIEFAKKRLSFVICPYPDGTTGHGTGLRLRSLPPTLRATASLLSGSSTAGAGDACCGHALESRDRIRSTVAKRQAIGQPRIAEPVKDKRAQSYRARGRHGSGFMPRPKSASPRERGDPAPENVSCFPQPW
jgi:hypothetical protein